MSKARERHCKIVATVGPASASPSMLRLLYETGVDVFRLNFSHGEHAAHGKVLAAIRQVERDGGRPVCVFADLQGPKIRCGKLAGGGIQLRYNGEYRLFPGEESEDPDEIPVPHPELLSVLEPGDDVKLDDGKLVLKVDRREGEIVIAKALTPGRLTDRKGINVAARQLPISALTEKDRADLAYALDIGVDYVALSFVQRPEDIDEAREIIGDKAGVIAKIEKPSAVDQLEEIVARADAIMVARGDLGVELPPEHVPMIQRRLVRACRAAGKPVIVATHMLESMVEAPSPTRAEASDVATAVLQGADAVMLSAETAVGRHPPTAVAIMDRIIKAAESDGELWRRRALEAPETGDSTADAISLSAREIADVLECRAAVAYTATGSTAWRIARDRPRCAIVALTPNTQVARRLALGWGLEPVVAPDVSEFMEMVEHAEAAAREHAGAKSGERIIIVAGVPFGRPGKTNSLKISRLE